MNVICPKCKEAYSINTELFLDKEHKLQCIACGYIWNENFAKIFTNEEKNFLKSSSTNGDRKLSKEQILKIFREEVEFDQKLKDVVSRKFDQKTANTSDEIQGKELSVMELLRIREFWFGFGIALVGALLSYLLYINAETLIKKFPLLGNYLGPFVDFVDIARAWIDDYKKEFIGYIRNRVL